MSYVQMPSGVIISDFFITQDRVGASYWQDNTPILERNKEQRKDSDENWRKDDDIKHVGRIPRLTWLLWESMGITRDPNELMKALERHPEFKTTEKRLA